MSKLSFSNRSLKFKTVALCLGIVAMLGASSCAVIYHIIDVNEASQLDAFEQYSHILSDAISAQFYERYGDVQAFAINPSLQSSSKSTVIDTLNTYSNMYGIYDLIMVVDAKGNLIAVNNKSPEGKPIQVDSLYQKNYSDTPWFKSTMSGQTTDDKDQGFTGTFFEDAQVDPSVGIAYGGDHLGTSFTAPIKNQKGEVIGVVSNRAGSRWFESAFYEMMRGLKKNGYPQSQTLLLAKDGTLLFEFTSDPTVTKLDPPKYDFGTLLKFNLLKSGNNAAALAASRQSGATRQINSRTQVLQVTGYAPVEGPKFIKTIGWSVLVRDSVAEVTQTAIKAKHLFNLSFAVMILLASLLAYWFSNTLSRRLSILAGKLSAESTHVASAAGEISQASTLLSDAAAEQASAIQETAASIDEVSSMVKKSAENANSSQTASQTSRDAAIEGKHAVQNMIQSIQEISESNAAIMNQVEEGNRKISEIVQVISEIENKTKVINDIVFQTKLLSFNASVEAARAGEHGKGFAVVAEEVGNLATMSGNAAKEISGMLETSIQTVRGIVEDTKSKVEKLVIQSKQKVDHGTKVAHTCGTTLENILNSVQQVDGMVGEIASASHEQAQGVTEINKAINQLDQVTHQNTAVAQQSAASSQDLSAQSIELNRLVQELSSMISGSLETPVLPLESKPAKVLQFPEKRKAEKIKSKPQGTTARKLAAGMENSPLPSQDDPRFRDI